MSTIQNTYQITGMHCQSCEKLVQKRAGKLAGVSEVEVSSETGAIAISADREIAKSELAAVLEETEYKVV